MLPYLGHILQGFQPVISILHGWSYVNSITMMLRRRRRSRRRDDDDDGEEEEELKAMKGDNDENG